MQLSATEAAIRTFMIEDVLYDKELKDLAVDVPLLESGMLDSLSILKTVTFCEEQFAITIPDEAVVPENFETVRAIASLVERVRAKE